MNAVPQKDLWLDEMPHDWQRSRWDSMSRLCLAYNPLVS